MAKAVFAVFLWALHIAWPANVDKSTAARCIVVRTTQVTGPCIQDYNTSPQIARYWRTCAKFIGIPEPNEIDLYTGESSDKAIDQCKVFWRAFDKRMKGSTR